MPALRATYRLQLTPDFGFDAARDLVPHITDLGCSHLYLSPSFAARAGSTHGYDVTDPTRVSDELGGEDALRRLAGAGLGVILDIVPNHMATDPSNPWWADEVTRRWVFDIDPGTGRHRRFFDVDELAGVRQEDPAVFELTHATALRLLAEGVVDGLRVDHPDGLADPAGYLARLRDRGAERVWVEKILHRGEALRDWPVSGTVGYEVLNDLTAVFTDPGGEDVLTSTYADLTGDAAPFAEVGASAKREQAATTFAPEVAQLRTLLDHPGMAEAVAALEVYRTYVDPASGHVSPEDRKVIEAAGLPGPIARALLLEDRGLDAFVTRFQQATGPVMAKGVEDTAFYRSVRLLSHNEVGGDPGTFSLPVEEFHRACAERLARHPDTLLPATTHDTKRSGDARARLVAVTGDAERFAERARRWFTLTDELAGPGGADGAERWFLFQTLLSAWPITMDRLDGYLVKAMREAKRRTSWVEPDEAHEAAVLSFARDVLVHPGFLADFLPYAEELATAGEAVSLGQTLLRCTVPGVPDVYQGDETWFLGLVDPDNRRTIDDAGRRAALDLVRSGAEPTRATAKLHLVHHCLGLRANLPDSFARGGHTPVAAGPDTCAFLRGDDGEVLVVAPLRGGPGPRDTIDLAGAGAAAGRWEDALRPGRSLALGAEAHVEDLVDPVLGVALLTRR